jgi:uncharacterized delta-60 repeat protein
MFVLIFTLVSSRLIGCQSLGSLGDSNSAFTPKLISPPADYSTTFVDNNITAFFDRDLLAASINNSSFTISSPEGNVNGIITYDAASKRIVFTPFTNLSYATKYTVVLASTIKDTAGNEMGQNYSWSFTTIGADYKVTGIPDLTFGENGVVVDTNFDLFDQVYGVAITSDASGKILVAGNAWYPASLLGGVSAKGPSKKVEKGLVWRYHPDGTLDNTFGSGGRVGNLTPIPEKYGSPSYPYQIFSMPNGKIFVNGETLEASQTYADILTQLNYDGSIYKIESGEKIEAPPLPIQPQSGEEFNAFTKTADGKYIIAGISPVPSSGNKNTLWRYFSNGTLDTGFGTNGKILLNDSAGIYCVTTDGDGNILFTSQPATSLHLYRFLAGGTPDNSFGDNGVVAFNTMEQGAASAFIVDRSGRIVVVGNRYINGMPRMTIWRFQ